MEEETTPNLGMFNVVTFYVYDLLIVAWIMCEGLVIKVPLQYGSLLDQTRFLPHILFFFCNFRDPNGRWGPNFAACYAYACESCNLEPQLRTPSSPL